MAGAALVGASGACHDPPGPGYGGLLIAVVTPDLGGTPLASLTGIQVDGQRIDVVLRSNCADPSTERVITVEPNPMTVRLLSVSPNVPLDVANVGVPVGCVTQVRLITEDMTVTLGADVKKVKVPSGPQTGIKIVPSDAPPQNGAPFPIVAGQTTAILIKYDPNSRLVFNKGVGTIEKPVLDAVQVPTDTVTLLSRIR